MRVKTVKINISRAAIIHIKMLQRVREIQDTGTTLNMVEELRSILPEEDRHLPLQVLFKKYPSFEKTLMIVEFWPESVHSVRSSKPCSSKTIRSKQTNVQKQLKSEPQQHGSSSNLIHIETGSDYASAQTSSIKQVNIKENETCSNAVSTSLKLESAPFNQKVCGESIDCTQPCSSKKKNSNRRKSLKNKDAATIQQNDESIIQPQQDNISLEPKVANEPTEAGNDLTIPDKKKKTKRSKRKKGLINKDIIATEQRNESTIQAQQDNAPFEHKTANEPTEGGKDQPCSDKKKKNKRSKGQKAMINHISALALNNNPPIEGVKDKVPILQKEHGKPMSACNELRSSSSTMISQQKIEAIGPSILQQSGTLLENQVGSKITSGQATLEPLGHQLENEENQFHDIELDHIAHFDELLSAVSIQISEFPTDDDIEEIIELFDDTNPKHEATFARTMKEMIKLDEEDSD